MSQARNGFFGSLSTCLNSIKNNRFARVSAGIVLVTSIELLDFICSQKMLHDEVDWNYYNKTPSRIIWLLLSGILQGINLETVANAIQQDSEHNASDRISAKKTLAVTTASAATMIFTNLALTTPITMKNSGYIFASSVLKGALGGALLSGGSYFLNKLNFSIRPITAEHAKWVSLGIVFATTQELLNFVCEQMIKQDSVEWHTLVSPARLLAWHTIVAMLQGTIYGITKLSYRKYSQSDNPEINFFQKAVLTGSTILTPIAIFTELSLTTPINKSNAGYIFLESLTKGIPNGLLAGANLCIFTHLFHQRTQPLVTARTPFLDNSQSEEHEASSLQP